MRNQARHITQIQNKELNVTLHQENWCLSMSMEHPPLSRKQIHLKNKSQLNFQNAFI